MSEAPFTEGDSVFEQGEEGDAFYVILEGEVSGTFCQPQLP